MECTQGPMVWSFGVPASSKVDIGAKKKEDCAEESNTKS
jgi:hypothetical protein